MSFDFWEAHREAVEEDYHNLCHDEDANGWIGEERNAPGNLSPALAELPVNPDIVSYDRLMGHVVYRSAGLSEDTEEVRKCQHAGRAAAAGVSLVVA